MQKKDNCPGKPDKTLAAVCGLYCEACTLFIATKEDPARLKGLARDFTSQRRRLNVTGVGRTREGLIVRNVKCSRVLLNEGLISVLNVMNIPVVI